MRVFASLIRGFEKLIMILACFQSCIWTSCFTCSAGNRPQTWRTITNQGHKRGLYLL